MSVPLDIDDLPNKVRRTMERRAAVAGIPPAEYARRVLAEAAAKPTLDEFMARIEAREPVHLTEPDRGHCPSPAGRGRLSVLDTSVAVDVLLRGRHIPRVARLLRRGARIAAPDVLVPEVLGVLPRQERIGVLSPERAVTVIADLSDLAVELLPSLPLRRRV